MVKNEEKNLDRCLSSLENLRKSIDNELIIIDTGSTDSTVEIAKKYTDRVYFHPWNNNFSEMRNISISYAKGEWVFILDADEELVDDMALIKILRNKNIKASVLALILKNIVNSSGKFGGDLVTTRVFKNDGFFHYEGSVHNMAVFKGEGIKVDSLLYHYGYIADDSKLMENKFDRTSKLLLLELERNPENIYYTYQLGSTYDMHKDDDLAEVYFTKAYEMAQNETDRNKFLYLYGALSKTLLTNKKYEKTVQIANEGLLIDGDYLDLLYFSAIAYLFMDKLDLGTKLLEAYLVKRANYNNLRISLNTSIQMYTFDAEEEVRQNLVKAYFKGAKYSELLPHAKWLLENMNDESSEYGGIVSFLTHAYFNLNDTKSIIMLYEGMEKKRWDFLDDLLYSNLKLKNWNDLSSMISDLSGLQSLIGKLLRAFISGVDLNDLDDIRKCLELGYSEALMVMIDKNVDISNVLIKLTESKIMEVFSDLNEKYGEFERKISLYINERASETDIKSLNMQRITRKYLGIKNFNDSKYMLEYFEVGIMFLKKKYTDEFINNVQGYGYLNSEEQLLSLMCWSEKHNEKINSETIEQTVNYFPEWSNHIYKWYEQQLNVVKEDDEISALLEILKENIHMLLNAGQSSDVLSLIDEYLVYKPNDLEIILLKSEILVEKTTNNIQ